jgi:hypothetical protein
MSITRIGWLAGFIMILVLSGSASAQPASCATPLGPADCPPSMYPRWHYWTPSLYRLYVCCHGPILSMTYHEVQPPVPPRYITDPKPCPATEFNTYGFQR